MLQVFAVRVRTADGGIADLLLFDEPGMAEKYAKELQPILGFDSVEVVPRRIIGSLTVHLDDSQDPVGS